MKNERIERTFRSSINISFFLVFIFSLLLLGCQGEDVNDEIVQNPVEEPEIPKDPGLGQAIDVREGDFTIVALPDTQYYVARFELGGNKEMFYSQIDWIKENQEKENIVHVAQLGDISENGDQPIASRQWEIASNAMYGLEYPKNIPYGVAVGNHDQWGGGTTNYNQYFGVEHFEGRYYYGGHLQDNNNNHFDSFSAGGLDFIVIYLEYDEDIQNTAAIEWADKLLKEYSTHKAILVSHYIINNNGIAGTNEGTPGEFSRQGEEIYEQLKDNPNLFMMLCGHVAGNGEGYREDTYEGNTVRTFLSNYQGRKPERGNGRMRIYKISVKDNVINVRTFAPYANIEETDGDSKFTTPLFD